MPVRRPPTGLRILACHRLSDNHPQKEQDGATTMSGPGRGVRSNTHSYRDRCSVLGVVGAGPRSDAVQAAVLLTTIDAAMLGDADLSTISEFRTEGAFEATH